MAPAETAKFLTSSDGTQVYASAVGDPSKPAVVFIHGLAVSSIVFDSIFADSKWTDLVFLVRYDMRGHGRSGKPEAEESWASARISDDFDAVVNGFGLKKPYIAAWSLGATCLADILTFHKPDIISGIVYISAMPYLAAEPKVGSPFMRASTLPALLQMTDVVAFQNAAMSFIHQFTRFPEAMPYLLQQALLGNIMSQPRAVALRVMLRTQDERALLKAGRNGDLPLLVVLGTHDTIVKGPEALKAIEGWKNMEVAEMPGGHFLWIETEDVFRSTVLKWLEKKIDNHDSP